MDLCEGMFNADISPREIDDLGANQRFYGQSEISITPKSFRSNLSAISSAGFHEDEANYQLSKSELRKLKIWFIALFCCICFLFIVAILALFLMPDLEPYSGDFDVLESGKFLLDISLDDADEIWCGSEIPNFEDNARESCPTDSCDAYFVFDEDDILRQASASVRLETMSSSEIRFFEERSAVLNLLEVDDDKNKVYKQKIVVEIENYHPRNGSKIFLPLPNDLVLQKNTKTEAADFDILASFQQMNVFSTEVIAEPYIIYESLYRSQDVYQDLGFSEVVARSPCFIQAEIPTEAFIKEEVSLLTTTYTATLYLGLSNYRVDKETVVEPNSCQSLNILCPFKTFAFCIEAIDEYIPLMTTPRRDQVSFHLLEESEKLERFFLGITYQVFAAITVTAAENGRILAVYQDSEYGYHGIVVGYSDANILYAGFAGIQVKLGDDVEQNTVLGNLSREDKLYFEATAQVSKVEGLKRRVNLHECVDSNGNKEVALRFRNNGVIKNTLVKISGASPNFEETCRINGVDTETTCKVELEKRKLASMETSQEGEEPSNVCNSLPYQLEQVFRIENFVPSNADGSLNIEFILEDQVFGAITNIDFSYFTLTLEGMVFIDQSCGGIDVCLIEFDMDSTSTGSSFSLAATLADDS